MDLPDPFNTTRYQVYNVCIEQPQTIVAEGIWATHTVFPPKSTFTMLELQIITIFLTTQCFHFFLKRLGFSYFVSQVMVWIYPPPYLTLPHLVFSFYNILSHRFLI